MKTNQTLHRLAAGVPLLLVLSTFAPVTLGFTLHATAQTVARIAFSAPASATRKTAYSQIFSMNPDGSGVAQLTSAAANSDNPAWSPGQQYIAFIRTNYLMVMRADGSGTFPVAQAEGAGVSAVDWSPDGTTLAFQNGGIYKTVSGSGVITLVHAGNSPDWKP